MLIVDDDKYTCEILGTFLELKGHSCTLSNDGKSASELLQKNGFDRIILDISMPGFSGKDLLDELTKTGLIHKTKVVVYSALPFPKSEIDSLLKSGATTVVYKSTKFTELLNTLESI